MPPTAGRRHDALSLKAPRSPGISPGFPPFRLQGLHFLGRPPPPRACGSAPPAPARASWAPLPSDGPSASGEGPLPLPAGRLRTTFPACSRRPPRISTSPPAAPCPRRPRLSPPRASARTRSFSYRCPWERPPVPCRPVRPLPFSHGAAGRAQLGGYHVAAVARANHLDRPKLRLGRIPDPLVPSKSQKHPISCVQEMGCGSSGKEKTLFS